MATTQQEEPKPQLLLFLISQTKNNSYDTFDEAVVVSDCKENAIKIHPNGEYDYMDNPKKPYLLGSMLDSWAIPENVTCRQIGIANPADPELTIHSVVCASYHSG